MKKIVLCFFCFAILTSCGSGCFFRDCDETELYTYRIRNQTGVTVLITVGDNQQEVQNNMVFECSYSETFNAGLCNNYLEIRISGTNTGYRCDGLISDLEEFCFEDEGLISNEERGGIFKKIGTRVYEFVLTSELLESAFELPE